MFLAPFCVINYFIIYLLFECILKITTDSCHCHSGLVWRLSEGCVMDWCWGRYTHSSDFQNKSNINFIVTYIGDGGGDRWCVGRGGDGGFIHSKLTMQCCTASQYCWRVLMPLWYCSRWSLSSSLLHFLRCWGAGSPRSAKPHLGPHIQRFPTETWRTLKPKCPPSYKNIRMYQCVRSHESKHISFVHPNQRGKWLKNGYS